ncbi:MAG: hypothetical protein UHK60_11100 [Acutalibacteraceae bacterium]|nr:hypothetical protein [Acutalibacteraceae bacterium]
MGKELTKELELLRDYNQKGNLEPRLKLLIDYIDELEQENFNLREGIYIEKMSFQSEGRNFKELMEMPTYQELQEENNQLKEQRQELRSWLEEYKENSYGLGSYETGISDALGDVLNKLNELEGGKNE